MAQDNYYEILGVSEGASAEEIRRAFQKKARTLHPDINKAPDAEAKFKQVSEAYAVLSDDTKRKKYDIQLHGSPFMNNPSSPYNGYPYASGGSGFDPSQDFRDINDVFDSFMGFGGFGVPFGASWSYQTQTPQTFAYHPQDGSDVMVHIEIQDISPHAAKTKRVSYTHYVACSACRATGAAQAHEGSNTPEKLRVIDCLVCDGRGVLNIDMLGLLGFGGMQVACSHCDGTGKIIANPCEVCGGQGRVSKTTTEEIEIGTSVHDGDELVIAHKGHAGTYGKDAGNLIVSISNEQERLTSAERIGAQILSFALPYLAFHIYTQRLIEDGFMTVILLITGCFLLFKRGCIHPLRWYVNAARVARVSFLIACVFVGLNFLRYMAYMGR